MKEIKLFWYSTTRLENMPKENFGDLLSKYLVEKISKKRVKWVSPKAYRFLFFLKKNYLVIGSILSHSTKKSIVWGSGIIKSNENVNAREFLAIRGPKTRERLLQLGKLNVPEIYGDPAILTPEFYKPIIENKYKVGVICHYVDFEEISLNVKDENIKVINLLTNNVESKIDEILSCKYLISSSLHGVIIGHAYNKPSLWVKFSEKLYGDDIKFYDYFKSVSLEINNPTLIKGEMNELSLLNLIKKNQEFLLPKKSVIEELKINLMKVCPFKK